LAHPDAVFQSKVAFEGDGALFLTGRPNFGPNYGRQLAQPLNGKFQVEYYVQARADTGYSLQIWKDRASGPFVAGPICGVQYGKFHVNEVPDTGIKCEPGRWYKVTMRIDVPKQTWELFVDDKRFESPKPLKFRAKVESLAFIDFIVGGGPVYIDALRVTRLPDDLPPKELIASAGFNDAQGINSNPVPGSPYPLDSEGKQGGAGEPGWAGPWSRPSSPKFSFQKKVVHEGDGALYMSKEGADRRLAEVQRGSFGVEMFVQVPERGGFLCYLNNAGLPFRDGPVWTVKDGKFLVLDGPDNFRETGFTSRPGKWHKVALRVDVSRKEWQFFVDDTLFETPKPLRFRSAETSLDTLRFQCETEAGIYIDALRFMRRGLITPLAKDLIASNGFNNAKGLHSDLDKPPFALDAPDSTGGDGEPGWAGPWPAHPDAVFQSKVVFEGDGALYLKGAPNVGPNYGRQLAEPQSGRFQVEYRLQMPAGSNCGLKIFAARTGVQPALGCHWGRDGKFSVTNLPNTGFRCEPGRWHKIALEIDVPKQTFELFFDDQRFESAEPLKFGEKAASLSYFNFLVEGGAYIDALRITHLPDAPTAPAKSAPSLPADYIAASGFNHAKGLHSDLSKPPFPLDALERAGGGGEPGWAAPWPAHPKARFQSKVVFEGDGALYLEGSPNFGPNYGRQWTKAQTGKFQVEYHVQVPAGSSFAGYVWQHPRGADGSGPNWGVRDGVCSVHGQNTGLKCVPGQWHKLTLHIDVPSHTWEFFVDGKRFESPQPLQFRGKVAYLDAINFLVEGGVYVDDMRVTQLPDMTKDR
jgi:uncharacterized protein involved in high-affinity Fe2+ transport